MNKTVVISGSSQGLGLILANTFAAEGGWRVIGSGMSENRPEEMQDSVEYRNLDSSSPGATQDFWQQLKNEASIETLCLINNAGGYVGGLLLDLTPEDYAKQIQSVYFTAVHMTRGLINNFEHAKIFNMLSASAMTPLADNGAYGAAKSAAAHFFQSLQKQYPPEKYQISNLYPDKMATHGPDDSAMDPNQAAEFIRSLANQEKTFYLKDVYIYSLKH